MPGGTVLSRKTFWALLRRYGELAGLALPPHPHMLRHACGFALADQSADTFQRHLLPVVKVFIVAGTQLLC